MARSVTLTPTLKLAPKRHTYSTRLVEMSAVCSPSTANEKTPAKPGSASNKLSSFRMPLHQQGERFITFPETLPTATQRKNAGGNAGPETMLEPRP